MPDLANHRALITGASSGIGADMARILASWGCDLVLTARRQDRLDSLAEELRGAHDVKVRCVSCDLAAPGGVAALLEQIADEDLDILINNAGFGLYQPFSDGDWERQAQMLQLNVVSLVELTHRLLPRLLRKERRCHVLNVASIAAYQPVPFFACYAATKSFVRDFSEALAYELRHSNVSVTCVCPGGTRTEFADVAGQRLGSLASASMMSAEDVARIGLRAMLRRRRNIVTGFINALTCFLTRFLPRRATTRAAVLVLGAPQDGT